MRTELSKKEKKLLEELNLSRTQNARLAEIWKASDAPENGMMTYILRFVACVVVPMIIAYNYAKIFGVFAPVPEFENITSFVVYGLLILFPIVVAIMAIPSYRFLNRTKKESALAYRYVVGLKKCRLSRFYSGLTNILLLVSFVCFGQFWTAIFFLVAIASVGTMCATFRRLVLSELNEIKDGPIEFSGELYVQIR
jgi:hypothetical protein